MHGVSLPIPLHTRSRERYELCALFFLQAHAQALWYVPFCNVLKAHGLSGIVPYAFACASLASIISPVISGALADRHTSAERVLRWLSAGTAAFLVMSFTAIARGWGAGWVLLMLQVQHLFYAPTWGLAGAIVLANLRNPQREFGAIRVWGTFGWLTAGPLMSFVFHADTSVLSGFIAAAAWFAVTIYTFTLPSVPPPDRSVSHKWGDLLGLDSFSLLRDPRHRPVFLASALLSIPLAAFYPFAVMHLSEAGSSHPAAAMSLGQVSEVISMYALAPLLARLRFKTLFMIGMGFGVLRYALFALNTLPAILAGVALHGFCYALFFIPAQIYLDLRVDHAFRARAQTLLTLMTGGVGNLLGALSCGWWQQWCHPAVGQPHWTLYWSVLSVVIVGVMAFFGVSYRDAAVPPIRVPVEPVPEPASIETGLE